MSGASISTVTNVGAGRVSTADLEKENAPGSQRQGFEKGASPEQIARERRSAVKGTQCRKLRLRSLYSVAIFPQPLPSSIQGYLGFLLLHGSQRTHSVFRFPVVS